MRRPGLQLAAGSAAVRQRSGGAAARAGWDHIAGSCAAVESKRRRFGSAALAAVGEFDPLIKGMTDAPVTSRGFVTCGGDPVAILHLEPAVNC